MSTTVKNLLVELLVEELPPKALKKLGEAFGGAIATSLANQRLLDPNRSGRPECFASPRRLAVLIRHVFSRAEDEPDTQKLMPASVGWDAERKPTAALTKRLSTLGVSALDAERIYSAPDGKSESLYVNRVLPGVQLAPGLQAALTEAVAKLPIPKVMQYQLEDGWTSVNFVRPAHGLVALHGADVVPVSALGLQSGRQTQGHRFEAVVSPVMLQHADHYASQLEEQGAVVASFEQRRGEIVRQLNAAAAKEGLKPIDDEALLDEVTALVERPNVLRCAFESEFLAVPPECLILTMKANQKYFPLLDAEGKLTNKFLLVSNISPADAGRVIQGNERVVRPRLADAKFFFDQDRKRTLASRVPGLAKVVYHGKLGTQGERVERVRAIARGIAAQLAANGKAPWDTDPAPLITLADRSAALAKADLLTDMVGEFPELQGIMGRYYAEHDGEDTLVAEAIEHHYRPRYAGDGLARSDVGIVVALADKLESLAGLFGIGQLPTGDKDPFALRRHALGVIRMLIERDLPLAVPQLVALAFAAFPAGHGQAQAELQTFIYDRLVGTLRELSFSAQEVDAVVALRPERWGEIPRRLAAVRSFTALPEAPALAAANKRVGNILKKSDDAPLVDVNPALLAEPAEQALYAALGEVGPRADAAFAAGDHTGSLQSLAALKAPVDAFFDGVMVNADDLALRNNRLALLRSLHAAMNRVADLSRLAA